MIKTAYDQSQMALLMPPESSTSQVFKLNSEEKIHCCYNCPTLLFPSNTFSSGDWALSPYFVPSISYADPDQHLRIFFIGEKHVNGYWEFNDTDIETVKSILKEAK
jgi:hypothetical protein